MGDRAGIRHDHIEPALTTIDKLDKIGVEGVEKELSARIGPTSTTKLVDFFRELASLDQAADIASEEASAMKEKALNAAILGRLVEFVGDHEKGSRGVEDLRSIIELSEGTSAARRIRLDPSLARGLSYYTGAIIEINVSDLTGSLGGGGRYDNLVGMFLGKDVPACGFSLGLERIIVVMSEREMFPPELISSPADVMVTIWNEDSIAESIALATELRREGLRVDLYPEADKMGKQFKYASSRGIPFVLILGDDERAHGELAIKNMKSGEQIRLPFELLKTSPQRNVQHADDQTVKSKRNIEALLKWLRNGSKAGEAGDSIKPGA